MALLKSGIKLPDEYIDQLPKLEMGNINALVVANRSHALVEEEEQRHTKEIKRIARSIIKNPEIKVITVAGPSSSGKTTFAHRLARELTSFGLQPEAISLDNFFVDRHETPINEEGDRDYEVIEAVDVNLYRQLINKLLDGETVQLPKYNFISGSREPGETIIPSLNTVYLVEGLHGMNPLITDVVPSEHKISVYVSPASVYTVDNGLEINPWDVRLLRRMVRDQRCRGAEPEVTFQRWPMVRNGEKKYIIPFAKDADFHFNSGLHYELGILKPFAYVLLNKVDGASTYQEQANQLMKVLRPVHPILCDVPDDSILREFIGGCSVNSEDILIES